MACVRIDIRRSLPSYVNGELSSRKSERVEWHLLDCAACRSVVVRLRDTRALLQSMPSLTAAPLSPALLHAPGESERAFRRDDSAARKRGNARTIVTRLAGDLAVAAAMFAVFAFFYTHSAAARARLDWSSFKAVRIPDLPRSQAPHVIAEGIVMENVSDSGEGGVSRFKLADPSNLQASVVCEVLDGEGMEVPPQGTRVRVYGVSRFDARQEHRWFEIHPVLRLEVVRK
jgi:anti-sigma factor RsiW